MFLKKKKERGKRNVLRKVNIINSQKESVTINYCFKDQERTRWPLKARKIKALPGRKNIVKKGLEA